MPYTSTIVVTGGTSGLGYATAMNLSQSHPDSQIVITGRTLPPGALDNAPNTNIVFLRVDLSTHASTRAFAAEYHARGFPPISSIILNAGVQVIDGIQYSPDDIELMFATNHVNHSLLFYLLASELQPDASVVIVSSSTHDPKFGRAPEMKYVSAEEAAYKPYGSEKNTFAEALARYALSKLANLLFAYALHDYARQNAKGWIVMTLDPGVIPTRLYRHTGGIVGAVANWALGSFIGRFFIGDLFTAEFVASTVAEMATGETFSGIDKSGKYYGAKGAQEIESSEKSHDKAAQRDLWDWTLKTVMTGDERKQWAL